MEGPARAAVDTVERRAAQMVADDRIRLERAMDSGLTASALETLVDGLRSNCRLTVNFHPDRMSGAGESVAEGLLEVGRYRPQNETGLSSGARFVAGGQRTGWERELFGSGYDDDPHAIRPIYGALDVTHDPHGGSPRFGSCFLVLRPHCADRTTLTVGDSHLGPPDVGTFGQPMAILAGLFEFAALKVGLGRGLSVEDLRGAIEGPPTGPAAAARELDNYVEAQVHGPLSLADDVAEVIVDPSFARTEAAQALEAASDRYGFQLAWHGGSELAANDVPADFRGPEMVPLAQQAARADGVFDAACIGRLAAQVPYSPPTVAGDAQDSMLQQVKRLWHCLVRFGADAALD